MYNRDEIEKVMNDIRKSNEDGDSKKKALEKNIKDAFGTPDIIDTKKSINTGNIIDNNPLLDEEKIIDDRIGTATKDLPDNIKEKIEENKLSKEDFINNIDKVMDVIDNLTPKKDKKDNELLEEAKKESDNFNEKEMESKIVDMKVNPKTGSMELARDPDIIRDISISDIDKKPIKDDEIRNEIKETFQQYGGLSNADAEKLLFAIVEYRKDNNVSVYNLLPESIRAMCRAMALKKNLAGFHSAAKDLIKMFINNINIDKEIVDFDNALNKELDIQDLGDQYCDYLQKKMEVILPEAADKMEATNPSKAALWRKLSKAFTDSYTFTRELETLSQTGAKRFIKKNTEDSKKSKKNKAFTQLLNKINYKYANIDKGIRDINDVVIVLSRKLDKKYDVIDIKRFIALYYLTTMNYNPENIIEHCFMYYTISNILSLDYLKDSEFNNTLLNNIHKVLDKIREEFE